MTQKHYLCKNKRFFCVKPINHGLNNINIKL